MLILPAYAIDPDLIYPPNEKPGGQEDVNNNAPDIDTALQPQKIINNLIETICEVAKYIGIIQFVVGVFMFIMAYKDDNAESQSRGARLAVVGALLIGLKPLLKLTGLIK